MFSLSMNRSAERVLGAALAVQGFKARIFVRGNLSPDFPPRLSPAAYCSLMIVRNCFIAGESTLFFL